MNSSLCSQCRLGPLPRTPTSDHCPDTSLGMLQLAAAGSTAQENTYSQVVMLLLVI